MTDDALILAIDQGTTNTKAILVDRDGAIVGRASRPMDIEYPRPGWVQQDADAIWDAVRGCVDGCLASAGSPALSAVAVSNQRETGIAWDRASGRPIGPAVTWQCRRSAELCEGLRAAGSGPAIQARTGLPVDPMFTAGKLRWLLDALPDGQARAEAGELCVGTVDSWLLWNLTGGAQHRTDVSNASRTQLMDISAGAWDAELSELFRVPLPALPEILPSNAQFGETVAVGPLPAGTPIRALIGDSHAALFGHASFAEGSAKSTYGTGSSLMMPTSLRLAAGGGLASTVAWGLDDGIVYALEGNIYVTGAAVQWLADFAGLAGPDAVADLAAATPSPDGVYLVPAFVGLGAPHWAEEARGLITGLTRASTLGQLARATIESIAYQVRDVFEVMQAASSGSLAVLLADGGVTRNTQLMQFQADILGLPVQRNDTPELSAMGAAYLAGLASGTWASTDEIAALPRTVVRFEPRMAEADRDRLYSGWQEALARATLRPG
jgi:glycerol kinase